MAITSSSQVLNLTSVRNATNILDGDGGVIYYLSKAKESLNNAKKFCDTSALETNEGNTFPEHIDRLIADIEQKIKDVQSLKANVNEMARRINQSENYQLMQYQEEQRMKQEEAEKALAQNAVSI